MKRPTSVACIQDVVHIAVKLKTRLIKPSILLPFGNYLAGIHHLQIVQQMFSKDQHGLRERDINYKDKQNYEAVLRITSNSLSSLLKKIPDAKGTATYFDIMKAVIDSYLDKSLDCTVRIHKVWYVVFVLRYWCQWIILHPEYTISKNFITSNTYMCIKLNAHSLISHLLSLQMLLSPDSDNFVPWLLGSQCCEKLFRAARSMSSTFSTIINFGLLGLLRRVNHLQIQLQLESECEDKTIRYPRVEAHKKKDGYSQPHNICKPHSVTKEEILKSVQSALTKAKETIENLGMADLLKSKDNWNNPPIPGSDLDICEDHDPNNSDEGDDHNIIEDTMQEVNLDIEPDDVSSGIIKLEEAKLMDEALKDQLHSMHNACFKKVENTALPIYQKEAEKTSHRRSKVCQFVEVKHGQKQVYIHKTTAIWLLQEGERVSSDRLFRVRAKQPFSNDKPNVPVTISVDVPTVYSTLEISNLCVFKFSKTEWKIGRLLQFAYYLEKMKSAQQYKRSTANVDDKKVGVLCSWYTSCNSFPRKFSLMVDKVTYDYTPLCSYLCTLPQGCFEHSENTSIPNAIGKYDDTNAQLVTSQHLIITEHTASIIHNLFQDSTAPGTGSDQNPLDTPRQASKRSNSSAILISGENFGTSVNFDHWITCGRISLTKKDKQHILGGKELSDLHINAFQSIAQLN